MTYCSIDSAVTDTSAAGPWPLLTPGTVPGVPASGRDVHLIETVYVRCPPAPWRSSQSSTHVWAGHSPALSPTRDRLTQNKKASVTCRLLESLISVPMPAERLA